MQPFEVHIDDHILNDLQARLAQTHWPSEPWADCLEDAHGEAAADMNRTEVPWVALSIC